MGGFGQWVANVFVARLAPGARAVLVHAPALVLGFACALPAELVVGATGVPHVVACLLIGLLAGGSRDVLDGSASASCVGCRTAAHTVCAAHHGGCVTYGCGDGTSSPLRCSSTPRIPPTSGR